MRVRPHQGRTVEPLDTFLNKPSFNNLKISWQILVLGNDEKKPKNHYLWLEMNPTCIAILVCDTVDDAFEPFCPIATRLLVEELAVGQWPWFEPRRRTWTQTKPTTKNAANERIPPARIPPIITARSESKKLNELDSEAPEAAAAEAASSTWVTSTFGCIMVSNSKLILCPGPFLLRGVT